MTATVVVEAPGPLTLVQDLGRVGSMHLGVPTSGALDTAALALANRLVGNRDGAAGLEILLGGLRFRPDHAVRVAVTGPQVGVRIDDRAASWGVAESVRAGELVEIVASASGLRCWLAVSGGVDVPEVLGSRSTDTFSGLGPAGLEAGTVLPLGGVGRGTVPGASAVPVPRSSSLRLPLMLGPRDNWFTDAALDLLLGQEYAVASDSDRTALRLEGTRGLERRETRELASEGLVTGAVQVPASGQPLVFLADHPVTGGYPVVGVISSQALAACAQARPGDRVRFRAMAPLPRR
jgi:biotin-dependent carboxylase-like uncharacterized protein